MNGRGRCNENYLFYNRYKINENEILGGLGRFQYSHTRRLSVGNVVSSRTRLNRGSVSVVTALQQQLNLVDTSVKCGRAAGEVVLARSRRDRHLEVDRISSLQRNALNGSGTSDAVKTRGSGVGNLAHQLAREVGGGRREVVGAVLVIGRTIGSVGLVNSVERSINRGLGSSTLGGKIGEKCVFIAKEINTVRSVEELLSKVAEKVVLDEVLRGDDIAGSSQDGVGEQTSVDGVQRTIGGPSVHVDVILDIGSINVIDIKRVGLELEDILHIRQLHVVEGNGADIQGGGGFTGELTRDTESKFLVKTSEGKIDGHFAYYNNSKYFISFVFCILLHSLRSFRKIQKTLVRNLAE